MQTSVSVRALAAAALAALCAGAPHASGAIVGVTGQTQQIAPPPSCVLGALQTFDAQAWDEQTNVPLNLVVDMVNNPGTSGAAVAGLLNGVYNSHFIHYEGIPGVITATGTVTFNAQIVGVAFSPLTLDATDALAGAGGTVYPTLYPLRGIFSNPVSSFSINNNVLSFNIHSLAPTAHVVQIRVFTLVPAPGGGAALAALGLLGVRRKRAD